MSRTEVEVLADVKKLAVEYYKISGKPLGVTGEIAEYAAAECLGIELAEARMPGYDAIQKKNGYIKKIQIKGRWKLVGRNWGRVSSINTDKEFDTVMLVLMSGAYEVDEIWEAERDKIILFLDKPGSKARNERRSMGVSQFKSIGNLVWPRTG
ncbi:MAG: hypothetical protein JKY25_10035 [Robiginitomaculum sp.]|nr:hypothetical protein [Robiginitomaculum sp.]